MHSLCNKDQLTILQLSDQGAWGFCPWRFGPSAESLRLSRSYFVGQTCPGENPKCPRLKRKKEKPVKAATALSLASRALYNLFLTNPGAYAAGFIPLPTFVGSYQGGTPPFPGAPRDPSLTSLTLINMSVLLLSACRFGNSLIYLVALIVVVIV